MRNRPGKSAPRCTSTPAGIFPAGPELLLPLPGNLFRLAKRPQQVAAQNLVNVLLGIAAVEQFLGDVRVAGNVLQLSGYSPDTVIIGAEADVVDPGHLDDVLNVVN